MRHKEVKSRRLKFSDLVLLTTQKKEGWDGR